jgi:hypothetical protein
MGKNKPHVIGHQRVHHILYAIFGWRRVFSERPIDVAPEDRPTSELEPDFYVLHSFGFRGDQPGPASLP